MAYIEGAQCVAACIYILNWYLINITVILQVPFLNK